MKYLKRLSGLTPQNCDFCSEGFLKLNFNTFILVASLYYMSLYRAGKFSHERKRNSVVVFVNL